jgi:hypothetical protein
MSDVTDLADAEAARAEAETSDDEALEADEEADPAEAHEGDEVEGVSGDAPGEAVPPAVQGMDEKAMERMHKRVAQASATYAKKISEILGDEAQMLELCPRCVDGGFPGFIFPALMAPVDPKTKAAVLLSIGEEASEATEPDKYARQCDSCKGAGVTLSGSRRTRDRLLTCHDCVGRGWIAVGPERQGNQTRVVETTTVNGNEETHEPQPEVDLWGTPIGDPDYGVMPQYRSRPIPTPVS